MKKLWLFLGLAVAVTASCNDDETSETGGNSGTEINSRQDFLINIADNFAIPAYTDFVAEANKLKSAKDEFVANPTEQTLVDLRVQFTEAYKVYQPVAVYKLGKAESETYDLFMNAHPILEARTIENILSETPVDLARFDTRDQQGLPAIDFMVNGLASTDAEIVAFYTGNQGSKYKDYLSVITDKIYTFSKAILDDWNASYRDEFVNNDNEFSTGSFNVFADRYINYFEKRLRASKVGVPLGQFTSQPFPNNIESLYSPENSKALLVEAFDNLELIYTGKTSTEASFSALLIEKNRADLDKEIRDKFATAREEIALLDNNLKLQVETGIDQMTEVRRALQSIVISFKNDMKLVLGFEIITQDSDGD